MQMIEVMIFLGVASPSVKLVCSLFFTVIRPTEACE